MDEDPPESHVPVTWHERKSITAFETLCSGAVAGAIAKTVVAPADRVKIIYQVDTQKEFTLNAALRTARDIIETEGFSALWRGNGVQMVRVMPYAGVSFLVFPKYDGYMDMITKGQLPAFFGIDAREPRGSAENSVSLLRRRRRRRDGDHHDVPFGHVTRAIRCEWSLCEDAARRHRHTCSPERFAESVWRSRADAHRNHPVRRYIIRHV